MPENKELSELRLRFERVRQARNFNSPEAKKTLDEYSSFLFGSGRPELSKDQMERLDTRSRSGYAPIRDIPDIEYKVQNKDAYSLLEAFNRRMFPSGIDNNKRFAQLRGRPALRGEFMAGEEVYKGEPTVVRNNKLRYNLMPDEERKISDQEYEASRRMKNIDKAISQRYFNDFIKGTELEPLYNQADAYGTFKNISSNPELGKKFSKLFYNDEQWKNMVNEEGSKQGYGNNYANEYFDIRKKIYDKGIVGGDGAKEYNDDRSLYGYRNSLATVEPETSQVTLDNDLKIPVYENANWRAGATHVDQNGGGGVCEEPQHVKGFKPKKVTCGIAKPSKSLLDIFNLGGTINRK